MLYVSLLILNNGSVITFPTMLYSVTRIGKTLLIEISVILGILEEVDFDYHV